MTRGGNLTYDAQLPLYFAANDPDGVDNCWRTADDGLALTGGAPAINQGNDSSVPAGIMTDIVGNERFISSMVDMGAYELPCVAEAGLLNVTPSDDELVICESTDPGFTFVGEEALLDADYVYAFILTNSSGEIVTFNTNGDFDLATLAPGTYTVYGLSYASFNTPSDVSAYITSKTNISEIQSDDAGLVFCLELTGEAVPGDTNIITVLPKPVVSNQNATLCSEVASNLTLPAGSAEPAATFNITNIQSNGLSASAGNPAEDEGLTANAIADDAWTNTNSNPVEVIYTIVPVSAAGCEGDAFTVTLTIQPEPVGSNLQTAVCSGDVLNINLQNQITNGLAGVTFTYTVSSTNQASVPAAANRTTASAAAITDTYVNNTGQDVTITYTITPISADGCAGNTFTATVIVDGVTPGTVGNNQTVCVTKKPATLGTTIAASSSATITYKWEMSTEGCEGTFTEITDGVESDTAENLVFTKPLKKTTYFRRRVFSTRDGLQCEAASNCVTITVLNVDCGQFPWNGN
ncbi:MAG: PKD-like domain-containing protein [Saprospiraceae bacterium]